MMSDRDNVVVKVVTTEEFNLPKDVCDVLFLWEDLPNRDARIIQFLRSNGSLLGTTLLVDLTPTQPETKQVDECQRSEGLEGYDSHDVEWSGCTVEELQVRTGQVLGAIVDIMRRDPQRTYYHLGGTNGLLTKIRHYFGGSSKGAGGEYWWAKSLTGKYLNVLLSPFDIRPLGDENDLYYTRGQFTEAVRQHCPYKLDQYGNYVD